MNRGFKRMRQQLARMVFLLCQLLLSTYCLAEANLQDPTSPSNMTTNMPSHSLGDGVTSVSPDAADSPVLQAVMLGASHKTATISGQQVVLGQKYQQATLIKITETSVVLRNPDHTTQTLTMDYIGGKKVLNTASADQAKKPKKRLKKPVTKSIDSDTK